MTRHDVTGMIYELYPAPSRSALSDEDLASVYEFPGNDGVRTVVNFIASSDGAASLDGLSTGLGSAADLKLLQLGTDLADVVLVGAGTAATEKFRGARATGERGARRRRAGLAPVPVIAVVTGTGASLPPDSPVLTDTLIPSVVLTCAAVPDTVQRGWRATGADVVLAGDRTVDLRCALTELGRRGLRRVNCLGGPRLLGGLAVEDLVDELRLTVSPMIIGGDAPRIAFGPSATRRKLELQSVLTCDSALFLRYRTLRDQ